MLIIIDPMPISCKRCFTINVNPRPDHSMNLNLAKKPSPHALHLNSTPPTRDRPLSGEAQHQGRVPVFRVSRHLINQSVA
jgi:hypothetical protein